MAKLGVLLTILVLTSGTLVASLTSNDVWQEDDQETDLKMLTRNFEEDLASENMKGAEDNLLEILTRGLLDMEERGKNNKLKGKQRKEILNIHNNFRRMQGASNMDNMRWNKTIAKRAQALAETCVFEHGDLDGVGQNLASWSGDILNVRNMIDMWYNEIGDYNFETNECKDDKACGHYTQVVWATSRTVGCGFTVCTNENGGQWVYFACNYWPVGNYVGERPYKQGVPCTQCDTGKLLCREQLCDSKCKKRDPECSCEADCQNGGTVTRKCQCKCAPGWTGHMCTEKCEDTHENCGANPGWPTSWCDRSYVYKNCPKLCDICSCAIECKNGGSTNGKCECECKPGWGGPDCSVCEADCQNGGTVTRKCQCECAPGWTGHMCTEKCEDTHDNCGANPGWPTSWCDRSYVYKNCPKLCDICSCAIECKNGGSTNGKCECECKPGWGGPDCLVCIADCKNCGSVNSKCECDCKPGWAGPDCSEKCEDRHKHCGANPGWPTYWCDKSYVKDNCPKMCGLCQEGDGSDACANKS